MAREPKQPKQESSLEMVFGILALLFWSLVLIELLGITIMVGVSDIEPRTAAMILLGPALAIGIALACSRANRRAAAYSWPIFFTW